MPPGHEVAPEVRVRDQSHSCFPQPEIALARIGAGSDGDNGVDDPRDLRLSHIGEEG